MNTLPHIEFLCWPEMIILGGGASKKLDLFKDQFNLKAKIVPAQFLNDAGIIGAAMAAKVNLKKTLKGILFTATCPGLSHRYIPVHHRLIHPVPGLKIQVCKR